MEESSMINERALVAAMKNDYKGNGYKAAVGTEGVTICGHGWGVQTEMERVPKKALALLVEHLGALPEDGCVYGVSKADDPTVEMGGLTDELLAEVRRQAKAAGDKTAKQTPLTFCGWRVWQDPEDLTVLLMEGRLTAMVDSRCKAVRVDRQRLVFVGLPGEAVWVDAVPALEETNLATALESTQWRV
jgi:hypothetical protein